MRLPRDLNGAQLVRAMGKMGYAVSHQTGSHVRLTCEVPAQHHITIPLHDPLRIGTLAAILGDVAAAHDLTREELLRRLLA